LEQLSALKNRPKSTVNQLTRSSKIFKTIIQAIQDKKGENIISLDLKKYMKLQLIFLSFAKLIIPLN
jgi:ribosome-associated protein